MQADAILPLAGGTFDREVEAADLFQRGYAPRIVLTREPPPATRFYLTKRGVHVRSAEDIRIELLVALGVPSGHIDVITAPVVSTVDEARLAAAWAAEIGAHRLIVVTTAPHTARAKHVFQRYSSGGRVTFIMRPARLSEFTPQNWWGRRDLLRETLIELEKLSVYRLWY